MNYHQLGSCLWSNVSQYPANLLRSIGQPFEEEFKDILTSMESNINGVNDAVKAAAFGEQVSTHQGLYLSLR